MSERDREWIVRAAKSYADKLPRVAVDDEPEVEEFNGRFWARAWVSVTKEEAEDAAVAAAEAQAERDFVWHHSD